MSELFPQKQRDELIRELHEEIDDKAEFLKGAIIAGNHRGGSAVYDKAFDIGFRRAVAEMKRIIQTNETTNKSSSRE